MNHNVIESEHPLVTTIELKVYGTVNNLSLATAIYNWYTENKRALVRRDGVDLDVVTELLSKQLYHDNRPISMEGECNYAE